MALALSERQLCYVTRSIVSSPDRPLSNRNRTRINEGGASVRKVVIFGFLMTVSAHVVLDDSSQNEYYVTALKAPTGTSKLQSFYGTSVIDSVEFLGFAIFDDSLGGVALRGAGGGPARRRGGGGAGGE